MVDEIGHMPKILTISLIQFVHDWLYKLFKIKYHIEGKKNKYNLHDFSELSSNAYSCVGLYRRYRYI